METVERSDRERGPGGGVLVQENRARTGDSKAGSAYGVIDGAGILRGQAVPDKVVVEPHQTALDSTFHVPAGHNALHLAWSVIHIPQAWPDRHIAEIPSDAWVIPRAARVSLQVNTVDRSGGLGINLRHNALPVSAVGKGIGVHVVTQLTEHDSERYSRGQIIAVVVSEIDRIQGWDRGFEGGEVLVKDTVHAGAL